MYCFIAIVLLTTESCKKDRAANETEKGFDINNPEGYCIFLESRDINGYNPRLIFLAFNGGGFPDGSKAVREYQIIRDGISYGQIIKRSSVYTVPDNRSLNIPGIANFKVEKGEIISAASNIGGGRTIKEYVLMKIPETNQLSGKTFRGKYYQGVGSVFRNSFFYSFSGNALGAGITPPHADRTGSYQLIANCAAINTIDNGTEHPDVELLIKVNNTLRAQYYDNTNYYDWLYGTFTQQ